MSAKARLPWKQGRVAFCVCFWLSFFHLTYTLSEQLASLSFDYFSCYQHTCIKFPFQLPVTGAQGENLVSNPPVLVYGLEIYISFKLFTLGSLIVY